MEVPYLFIGKIDLLYKKENEVYAFIMNRYLNDYRMMKKVMIILNQLVRYYNCHIILYCFSFRVLTSREKIYFTFKKRPLDMEN